MGWRVGPSFKTTHQHKMAFRNLHDENMKTKTLTLRQFHFINKSSKYIESDFTLVSMQFAKNRHYEKQKNKKPPETNIKQKLCEKLNNTHLFLLY